VTSSHCSKSFGDRLLNPQTAPMNIGPRSRVSRLEEALTTIILIYNILWRHNLPRDLARTGAQISGRRFPIFGVLVRGRGSGTGGAISCRGQGARDLVAWTRWTGFQAADGWGVRCYGGNASPCRRRSVPTNVSWAGELTECRPHGALEVASRTQAVQTDTESSLAVMTWPPRHLAILED
jgi:hypothetical protein